MGIKGIYGELGPGQRVSLAKLAAESFSNANRPFRLAIDIAIWQFQTQAARGGTNPAIRTLFYRLVRLVGTPITPIFVFDGPHKPKFKRNKRSGRGDGVATAQAKRLIRLFGFVAHDAPGEAEAECALLQRHGIVDAVLSEDVDTIMFGCTRTLRNWSAEGKGSKSPTHVSMYDVHDMNMADLGLDREGMVLVALMSGGDYHPEGIPRCGVKVACEAAKAGFGKSVCRLKASDKEGLRLWRASFIHELRTNERKYFRTRHKALAIPDDFPNLEILRYYTHPVVSQESTLDAVRQRFAETRDIQLDSLREFARETFDWDFRIGAIKFIRVLGEALLVQKLHRGEAEAESFVKRISGRRNHFSTDGVSELRLAYVPEEVVPINLSKEVEEDVSYGRDGLALNSDNEFDAPENGAEAVEGARAAPGKVFDVTKPDLTWVLEELARKAAPTAFQAWEEAEQAKAKRKSPTKKKAAATKGKKTAPVPMPRGALDGFVRTTKAPKATEAASGKTLKGKEPSKPRSMAPPKPSMLRRPQTPPLREPSKQSSPTAAVDSPADWTIAASLPETPRPRRPAGRPETIVIPSSPSDVAPSPAPSLPPSPSRVAVPRAGEMPGAIRSILSAGVVSQGVTGGLRKGVTASKAASKAASKVSSLAKPSSQGTRLKQTSLDMFAKTCSRPQPSQPGPSKGGGGLGVSTTKERSNLEKTSATTVTTTTTTTGHTDLAAISLSDSDSPPSSGKRRQTHRAQSERNPSPSPSPSFSPSSVQRKKLLVPSASAAGFFDEIEVDADEYEERIARESRLLKSRGIRYGVARWSDVSVIDLTGED